MQNRHRKTLRTIFAAPTPAQMRWSDVESLLRALGTVTEREGSRIYVDVNGKTIVLHRPHPNPMVRRLGIQSVRDFLTRAGVTP